MAERAAHQLGMVDLMDGVDLEMRLFELLTDFTQVMRDMEKSVCDAIATEHQLVQQTMKLQKGSMRKKTEEH
eukprot:2545377-Pyramimonas_sp.AAC.1